MQSTDRDLRQMLGAYLRARSPNAKELARQIGCDPRTAEGFRAGRYWPQAKHWIGIVHAFGKDVTESVFHPDAATLRLAQELRELEDALAKKRADLRQAEGAVARLAKVRGRHEDRPAGLTAHDFRRRP